MDAALQTSPLTVKSGSKATLPTAVMAGAGTLSTTMLLATRKVVDGRPAPIGANLSGLACKAAFMPPPLPLLSPLPPRIKASSQLHKRYGIKHDRATPQRHRLWAAGLLSGEEAEAAEDVEMIFVACRSNDWKGHSGKRG